MLLFHAGQIIQFDDFTLNIIFLSCKSRSRRGQKLFQSRLSFVFEIFTRTIVSSRRDRYDKDAQLLQPNQTEECEKQDSIVAICVYR